MQAGLSTELIVRFSKRLSAGVGLICGKYVQLKWISLLVGRGEFSLRSWGCMANALLIPYVCDWEICAAGCRTQSQIELLGGVDARFSSLLADTVWDVLNE